MDHFLRVYKVILFLLISSYARSQSAIITEIVSQNATGVIDEDGELSDWIEIYNPHPVQTDLTGWTLTDGGASTIDWAFPPFALNPGDRILVFASGKDRTSGPFFHTNFKLKESGEPVRLVDPSGQIMSELPATALRCDQALARIPDTGSDVYALWSEPTPWGSNDNSVPIGAVHFSASSGYHAEPFQLSLSCEHASYEIRYTINGKDPTASSSLYSDSIPISNLSADENSWSAIPTTRDDVPLNWIWEAPAHPVRKANVVKARAFLNGEPVGSVYVQTFFVGAEWLGAYTIPVISLAVDSVGFFGDSLGIYVPGQHALSTNPFVGNYDQRGRDWERQIHFEVFNGNLQPEFAAYSGVRVHGASSRQMPMKSLRLYARCEGNPTAKFEHPFFTSHDEENFERLVLGSSGFDFISSHCADYLSTRLTSSLNVIVPAHRPVIVFINGEYWGIHYLRERVDEKYFEQHFSVPDTALDLIEFSGARNHPDSSFYAVKAGDSQAFDDLYDFVQTQDLSTTAAYQAVTDQIDVENFIDYNLCKLYFATFDWPGNNVRMWRSEHLDGQWRWVLFDHDDAFRKVSFDALSHATAVDGPEWPNPDWSTLLLRKLLDNHVFRSQFVARADWMFSEVFKPSIVLNVIDEVERELESMMEEHIDRWHYPRSSSVLQDSIDQFRAFAEARPCFLYQHFQQRFDISGKDLGCGLIERPGELIVAPNPNLGRFSLRIPAGIDGLWNLEVFDATGRKINSALLDGSANEPTLHMLQFAGLEVGLYTIRLTLGENRLHGKFVVAGNAFSQ